MIKKKRSYVKYLLQLMFFSVLIVTQLYSPVLANDSNKQKNQTVTCRTKQVILLVDQSASMNENDPTKLRYDGPLHLADILAKSYILAYQRSLSNKLERPVEIEFAVIQFASDAKIQIGWTTINPVDDDAWTVERKKIEPLLDLGYDEQKTLLKEISNGTNFIRAFNKVEELLGSTEQQEDGCPERLVMVMTDGDPDLSEELDLDAHMEEVKRIVDEKFGASGNEVYVTAFNVPDSTYWRDTEHYWDEITGEESTGHIEKAKQANNLAELGKRLTDIVIDFLGDPATIQIKPGRLVIPPYLERLTITFYKPEREDLIELRDDKGLLEPSRTDVEVIVNGEDGAIQTIDIIRPTPGVYELTTEAKKDEYVITQQLIFVNPQLISPTSSLQQFTQSTIKIKMVDSQGQKIPYYGDSKYALKAEASVIGDHAEIPITVAHLDTGILQGTYTPIEAGNQQLTVEAIAFDDNAQAVDVITKPNADYTLVVEPVTLEIGDEQSATPACQPAQYVPFEIPLEVINDVTQKPANLNVPVSLEAESSQDATFKIDGPDSNGHYTLRIISKESGIIDFTLRAFAANPIDGEQIEFFEKEVRIDLTPTQLLSLESSGFAEEADETSLSIYEWRNKFFGKTDADAILLGRRMFIYPQAIRVYVKLTDDGTGQLNHPFDWLPDLELRNQRDGETYQAEDWNYLGKGKYEMVFSDLPPGLYITEYKPQSMPCDMKLDYDPNLMATILVISDFWEFVISIVIVIVVLAIALIIVLWLLCKFKNPLKGFLAVIDGNGKRVWFQSIADRACWKFKMGRPEKQCYIIVLKVMSWHKNNGELCLRLKRIDPQTGDKIKETYHRSINSWTDINLPGGGKITHAMSQQELPKA